MSRVIATTRWQRRLLISEQQRDGWVVVDKPLLDNLVQWLPRLPHGLKVRSLDFSKLPCLRNVPKGLCCDQLNLSGTAIRTLPGELHVSERLDLSGCKHLESLPGNLEVEQLDLRGCTALHKLREGLRVKHLDLSGCTVLTSLPRGLHCQEINLEGTDVRTLPDDIDVKCRLNLSNCRELCRLPDGLRVQMLVLRSCTALTVLPAGLEVFDLDVQGCTELTWWQEPGMVHCGRLLAAGCSKLRNLPSQLSDLEALDLRECASVTEFPQGLRVREWIDFGGSGITALPEGVRPATLRWRGVQIDERIAFHPETLTASEVFQEPNVERRRVMMERMGPARFLETAQPRVLDRDTDQGGRRELLCVELPNTNAEALVYVSVTCPSTSRNYLLRVPPTMRTCQQAVAWTAGIIDPGSYRPIKET